jgi:hypothetical protein
MFWLPQNWVPYQAEWILSFPRAPLGSISVNIWGIACSTVIGLVTQAIVSLYKLQSAAASTEKSSAGEAKAEKVPVAVKKEL